MFRLFYISTAALGTTNDICDSIARVSARNNAEHDITGALVFNGVNFAQVLEGDETAVRTLYDIICSDPRHSGVVLVSAKPAKRRNFEGWAMQRIDGLNLVPLAEKLIDD